MVLELGGWFWAVAVAQSLSKRLSEARNLNEAEALGQLGAAAVQFMPKLADLMKDPHSDVRIAAASAGASEFGISGPSEPADPVFV